MTKLWFSTSCAALVLVSAQGLAAQNEIPGVDSDLLKQILERQRNLEEQNEDLRDEVAKLRAQISGLQTNHPNYPPPVPLAVESDADDAVSANQPSVERGWTASSLAESEPQLGLAISRVEISKLEDDQTALRMKLDREDVSEGWTALSAGEREEITQELQTNGARLKALTEVLTICQVPAAVFDEQITRGEGDDAKPLTRREKGYEYFAARPYLFNRCLQGTRGGDGQGEATTGVQPGRPLLQRGFFPQLEFGNKSKATLNASFPFRARRCNLKAELPAVRDQLIMEGLVPWGTVCAGEYVPVAWNITGTVKTDLEDGVGRLLDSRDRNDRTDLDFLPGTSLSLGLDYLRFSKFDPFKNLQSAVKDARTKCMSGFHDEIEPEEGKSAASICAEDKIVAWAMEIKDGKYVRPEIAAALRDSIWAPPKAKAKLVWGIGGSVEFSSPDFTFREGNILPDMNSDGDNILKVDPNVALASSVIESRSQWELELHALYSFDLTKTIRFMPVAQVSYRSVTEFQPGTKITLCSETAGSEFTTTSCSDIQAERSMRRDLTTLSLEGRTKFDRLPYIRALGFAPRLAHTIESGQTFLDLPFYVSDKSGNLSGGLRFRFARGGEDVLGNPLDDFEEISLFFTPLKFDSFK